MSQFLHDNDDDNANAKALAIPRVSPKTAELIRISLIILRGISLVCTYSPLYTEHTF